jgi:formylglycine-generating enzyme required for sulfatase activity
MFQKICIVYSAVVAFGSFISTIAQECKATSGGTEIATAIGKNRVVSSDIKDFLTEFGEFQKAAAKASFLERKVKHDIASRKSKPGSVSDQTLDEDMTYHRIAVRNMQTAAEHFFSAGRTLFDDFFDAVSSLTLATVQDPKASRGNEPTTAAGTAAKSAAVSSTKQITNSIGMKLTLVPSGEFMMGSGESAAATAAFFKKKFDLSFLPADVFRDEVPQHRVRITKPFYLGTYHVTRGQFRKFVDDSGYQTDAEKGDYRGAWGLNPKTGTRDFDKNRSWRNAGFPQTDEHPAVCLSWKDAAAFCEWLSKKEGKRYRLPTEAEWEYACRAGTTTRYYSGDGPETLAKVANVADAAFRAEFPNANGCTGKISDGFAFTSPVGLFKPNGFGLYDMSGNAFEFCADWYDKNYYRVSSVDDPKGPDAGDGRVIRGGGWSSCPAYATSALRASFAPDD